jgi:hypothetical protein
MTLSIQALTFAEADLSVQITLLFVWAAIWHVAIELVAKRCVKPLVHSRPWREQWIEHTRRMFKDGFFIDFKSVDEVCDAGCLLVAILCQHGVGATLCLPAMLGFRGPVTTALACHGALCEAGWEISDSFERMRLMTFGGEEGRAKNPPAACVIMTLHHCLCLSMVMPMNLMYRDNAYYHELVFLLQGAAFLALMAQFYGFTLNIAEAAGLRQMQAITGCSVLLMFWSRGGRFWYVAYNMVAALHADGNSKLVGVACVGLFAMGVFNLLIIGDSIKKFHKFISMSTTENGKMVQMVTKKLSEDPCSPRRVIRWNAKALARDQ